MSDVYTVNFTVFPLLRRFFDPHFGTFCFFAAVFRISYEESSPRSSFYDFFATLLVIFVSFYDLDFILWRKDWFWPVLFFVFSSKMADVCAPLIELLRSLENRPISSSERAQIQLEVQCFVKDKKIKQDSPILQSLSERLSFSYFPTVSYLKKSSYERKPPPSNVSPVVSDATRTQDSMIHPHLSDYYSFALQPAVADIFYVCSIRRIKSALSTSYRMSIENTRNLKNTSELSTANGNTGE